MPLRILLPLILSLTSLAILAHGESSFDAAAAFGARPSVESISFSPDGTTIAYAVPTVGQGSAVYILSLAKGSSPRLIPTATGKPDRLGGCHWLANDRLACLIYATATLPPHPVPPSP